MATLATRQAKQHQLSERDLRADWRAEAGRHDIPTGWWTRLLDRRQAAGLDRDELDRQLVGDQGLTAQASTFTLRDVHAAIAEHAADGAPVEHSGLVGFCPQEPVLYERPEGFDSPWTKRFIKVMSRVQTRLFKLTDGRIGSRWRVGAGFRDPVPTLLLEHTGRRSGRRYTTPLLYMDDGDRYVVVASQGGLPTHPQWYANLLAHPRTRIHVRGRGAVPVAAREAAAHERKRLWSRLVDMYADFRRYAAGAEREIPVLVREGDYVGTTVNTAAHLTDLARRRSR